MVRLFITVDDVDDIMTAGYTIIRIYTDTAEDGTFVTLDGTITLVAATESYEYLDLDGTSATWYRTAYWGAGPGESDQSPARRGATSAAYATVIEFRNEVGITSTTTDVEIAAILDGASRQVDRVCNRPDGFFADVTASARYFTGSGKPWQLIDECVEVTAVAVKDSVSDDEDSYTAWTVGTVGTTTSADCFPATGDPAFPDYERTPYTMLVIGANGDYSNFTGGKYTSRGGFRPTSRLHRGLPTVEVTARWGYSTTVPADIKQAALMLAAKVRKRIQSNMADTAASPELGTLVYAKELDPQIVGILERGRYIKVTTGRR